MLNIKKKVAMALATTAMGAMLIGAGTFAYFTSDITNEGNTFKAGTVKVDITGPSFDKTVSTNLEANMAPGDTVSKTFTVKNTGSLDLKYNLETIIPVDENPLFTIDGNHAIVSYSIGTTPITASAFRNLASGDSEVITANVNLPLSAGDAYQDKAGKFDLKIHSEQTKNR